MVEAYKDGYFWFLIVSSGDIIAANGERNHLENKKEGGYHLSPDPPFAPLIFPMVT